VLVWSGALGSLPDKTELQQIQNPVASEVYSADSVLIGRYFIYERSAIDFKKIPKHVIQAVIATEDIRFYEHHGIDQKSLGRVLVKSLLLRQSSGGGSTLTQQLAKNLFPRKEYVILSMVINKLREIIIASRLEDIYDKDELLTLYLNTIPFGDNTYGLEAAAQRFFGVPTPKLSIHQAAVLVGMLKANYAYNPRIFPERSLKRRNVVLSQMEKYGMLTKPQADSIKNLPLALNYTKISHHSGLAPYFREYLRPQLLEWCKETLQQNGQPFNLYTDGLKIYTTIDSRLQRYAEEAMVSQMKILQAKFDQHIKKAKPWNKQPAILQDAIIRSDRYKTLKSNGLDHNEVIKIMDQPTLKNIFTWNGEEEHLISSIDSIRHHLKFLNTGVLAIDPHSGKVRAWVGGIDHHYFQYDHVRENTKRQVGSTFKPIVYAAALEQGIKPCDFISAAKTVYKNAEGWSPANTENNYDLKYSMTGAMVHSVNTVSVKLLEKAGISKTIQLSKKMGITSSLPAVPALALGVANVSMFEMVTAYCSFANSGYSVTPTYITSITSHDNKILAVFKSAPKQPVMSKQTAQSIVYMMRQVVNQGTASGINRFGIMTNLAGKTGTTQSNTDGWFIGITPNLVIGSWVGADDPRIHFRTTALGQGAKTAMPIVGDFLQRTYKDPSLATISDASFTPLPGDLERKLSCDFSKEDKNVFERIFGKRQTEEKKNFGEKKKGFFERIFGGGGK